MHILVTAGPTREYLDDVRFLSNASTGAMGCAVAAEAAGRGHDVTLVFGPGPADPPDGVDVLNVVDARQMHSEVLRFFDEVDAVVMTAAVCDYRPEERAGGKIRKTGEELLLRLVPNPDILAELGRLKQGQVLIGFALEVDDARERAAEKLKNKKLDFIILDSPAAMGARREDFTIIGQDGSQQELRDAPKTAVARRIIDLIEQKGSP